jgi:hypothetical protein
MSETHKNQLIDFGDALLTGIIIWIALQWNLKIVLVAVLTGEIWATNRRLRRCERG